MEIRDNKPVAIAIDGPSGAGKSTIARILASELGCLYVDTGALYRTVGYAALCRGIDPRSAEEVEPLLSEITVELRHQNGVQRVWLNGEDVSDRIRTPEVSMAASAVSVAFINYDIMTANVWMILGSVAAFAFGSVIVWMLGKVTAD